jgi:hypothetical protein
MLKRTEENKERRKKERLDDYYRRNFKARASSEPVARRGRLSPTFQLAAAARKPTQAWAQARHSCWHHQQGVWLRYTLCWRRSRQPWRAWGPSGPWGMSTGCLRADVSAVCAGRLQDYFEFDGGSTQAAEARGLKADTAQAIARWLEKNGDQK